MHGIDRITAFGPQLDRLIKLLVSQNLPANPHDEMSENLTREISSDSYCQRQHMILDTARMTVEATVESLMPFEAQSSQGRAGRDGVLLFLLGAHSRTAQRAPVGRSSTLAPHHIGEPEEIRVRTVIPLPPR
jgi:hypothetical protein